ncbi:MAG: DUF368 domain-containing protein [Phycisphaeraceae bacterium]
MPMNPPGLTSDPSPPAALLVVRSALGGTLMGLANLVPGISGGTMLLAAGIYPRFINAIGEVTTLRFRRESMITLATVVVAAILAIALLAGPVKDLVVYHRWIMYSLFIGLTLGGVPVVWRLINQPTAATWLGVLVGFAGMAALAIAQSQATGATQNDGFLFMLLAGVAGASAMILPGVSGGYLLLVLGAYVPILAAISSFVDALKSVDSATLLAVGFGTILPVGLGVVLGIAAVSNLLRFLLRRYEKATLGVLLGLLLGAVVGLYPFVQPVAPNPGDILKNQTLIVDESNTLIYEQTGKAVEADDYPTATFQPTYTQLTGSLTLITLGIGLTLLVDRIGRDKSSRTTEHTKDPEA